MNPPTECYFCNHVIENGKTKRENGGEDADSDSSFEMIESPKSFDADAPTAAEDLVADAPMESDDLKLMAERMNQPASSDRKCTIFVQTVADVCFGSFCAVWLWLVYRLVIIRDYNFLY